MSVAFVERLLRVLTSHADPGSSTERQVCPARAKILPSLRAECFHVGTKDFVVAVHGVHVEHDDGALWDQEG